MIAAPSKFEECNQFISIQMGFDGHSAGLRDDQEAVRRRDQGGGLRARAPDCLQRCAGSNMVWVSGLHFGTYVPVFGACLMRKTLSSPNTFRSGPFQNQIPAPITRLPPLADSLLRTNEELQQSHAPAIEPRVPNRSAWRLYTLFVGETDLQKRVTRSVILAVSRVHQCDSDFLALSVCRLH